MELTQRLYTYRVVAVLTRNSLRKYRYVQRNDENDGMKKHTAIMQWVNLQVCRSYCERRVDEKRFEKSVCKYGICSDE